MKQQLIHVNQSFGEIKQLSVYICIPENSNDDVVRYHDPVNFLLHCVPKTFYFVIVYIFSNTDFQNSFIGAFYK